jgi:uncharacterized protein
LHLIPWLLLAATVLFLAGPRISAWVRQRAAAGKTSRPLNSAGFFLELLIAIYIGYFAQAWAFWFCRCPLCLAWKIFTR